MCACVFAYTLGMAAAASGCHTHADIISSAGGSIVIECAMEHIKVCGYFYILT